MTMFEMVCLFTIIIMTIVTGNVLRKQYKKNASVSCLPMAIAMTSSTLIGILITTWISDMVLSTISAVMVSILLIIFLTYSLPTRMVTEALSSAFMGGMMGAMLGIMIQQYMIVCIIFFMILYLFSTVTAIAFWNKEEYPTIAKAIPKKIIVTLAISTMLIGASAFVDNIQELDLNKEKMHMHHNH